MLRHLITLRHAEKLLTRAAPGTNQARKAGQSEDRLATVAAWRDAPLAHVRRTGMA